MSNPLIGIESIPAFDAIRAEHVVPAIEALLTEASARVSEIEGRLSDGAATYDAVVRELDDACEPLGNAWGAIMHLNGVMNSDALREAYEAVQGSVVQFSLRVGQSEPIYQALVALRDTSWEALDGGQKRAVTRRIRSAEHSGIGLQGDARTAFNAAAEELSKLSTEFSNRVLDATKAFEILLSDPAEVDGLPETVRTMLAESYAREKGGEANPAEGPWRLTLDYPLFAPFMQHATHRARREEVYRAFVSRASAAPFDNTETLERILVLRRAQAERLGYASYAELSVSSKMADVDAVYALIDELQAASKEPAATELAELQAFAAERGHEGKLERWDIAFWRERMREERFAFTGEDLRPYFPLERTLDGLFAIVERAFGVRVEAADGKAPVWHEDVRFFHVFDEDTLIAGFYLDPFARPGTKRGGAWMAECVARKRTEAGVRIPIAHLTCNGPPPTGDKPSLLLFDDVETLFHEFGHGLQHMLTTVDDPANAGISGVEWDAIELPSQFMENWCYHWETIRGMSAHVETGESLPRELFDKVVAARNYFAATDMLRQLVFGRTDMDVHHRYTPGQEGASATAVAHEVSAAMSPLPPLEQARPLHAFSHIFAGGYAAGYYSYKWAEVLAADAWEAFVDAGVDEPESVRAVGRRFRDTVLALGGSEEPSAVYRAFRGRDAEAGALLRHYGLAAR